MSPNIPGWVEYGFSHSGSQNKFVNISGASLLTAIYGLGSQLCWDKCWDPNFFWMKWKIWMSPNIPGWVEYGFSHSGSQNKFVNIRGASLLTATYALRTQLCWDKCWDPNFFKIKWKIWMSPFIPGWVEYGFCHSGSQKKIKQILA